MRKALIVFTCLLSISSLGQSQTIRNLNLADPELCFSASTLKKEGQYSAWFKETQRATVVTANTPFSANSIAIVPLNKNVKDFLEGIIVENASSPSLKVICLEGTVTRQFASNQPDSELEKLSIQAFEARLQPE